ncbi:hypothetical protein [Rhizobium leguminosarum]|uniref:hypothetical protein n=1 Tax=Rhizobium leguminosarum TaxID=384 RepID=UPI00056826F6|nr:hypothetical protein [Rhizobium leguminosarum]
MPSREIILIGEQDKEVADFLEKARASGSLRVLVGGEVLVVKVSSERVSLKGRDFLTKGHRFD